MASALQFDRAKAAAVREVFFELVGRRPGKAELAFFVKKDYSLAQIVEVVCKTYKQECEQRAEEAAGKLPLTLAIFAKDNEDSIALPIQNMGGLVREVVVVDTGSTDKTVEVAESLGARVYRVGFSDFGSIRTVTALLGTQQWVLGLDSDEILAPEELDQLAPLLLEDVPAWGLPRRRWADLGRTEQVELEAYPDRQYRLLRRTPDNVYRNRVHERLDCLGGVPAKEADGPHIEHFQDVFKKGQRLVDRNNLYKDLYSKDTADGILRDTPAVAPMDER